MRDGLETIDLSEENKTEAKGAQADEASPPEAFFRKTKSNNFFAVDDSLD